MEKRRHLCVGVLVLLALVAVMTAVPDIRAIEFFGAPSDLALIETPTDLNVYVADPRRGLLSGRSIPSSPGTISNLTPLSECGAYKFHEPVALSARGVHLVVVDLESVPVIVDCDLDKHTYSLRWKGEPLRLPTSVTLGEGGTVAVVDRELRGLFVVSPDGKSRVVRVGERPVLVRSDDRGYVHVLDRDRGVSRLRLSDPEPDMASVPLPPLRESASFAVFRDVFYTADGIATRVTVPSAGVSLLLPYGHGRPASVAVSEHYLAILDSDGSAVEITDRVADHLARAIRSLALTLGVQRVVIGGGVAAAGPALLEPIQSRIAHERAASPLAQAAMGDVTVELLSPIQAPGARGAAAIARHRIGLPEREGVGER